MLMIYGHLMPLRMLEEIRFWKMKEKEHAAMIRELYPLLEPEYAHLMGQWRAYLATWKTKPVKWSVRFCTKTKKATGLNTIRSMRY